MLVLLPVPAPGTAHQFALAESILDEVRALGQAATGMRRKGGVVISCGRTHSQYVAGPLRSGEEIGRTLATQGAKAAAAAPVLFYGLQGVCGPATQPCGAYYALWRHCRGRAGACGQRRAHGPLPLRNPETPWPAYIGEFTGRQLKVAPEHCAPSSVLTLPLTVFEAFPDSFFRQNRARRT